MLSRNAAYQCLMKSLDLKTIRQYAQRNYTNVPFKYRRRKNVEVLTMEELSLFYQNGEDYDDPYYIEHFPPSLDKFVKDENTIDYHVKHSDQSRNFLALVKQTHYLNKQIQQTERRSKFNKRLNYAFLRSLPIDDCNLSPGYRFAKERRYKYDFS